MQHKTGKSNMLLTACAVILLSLAGLNGASATEAVTEMNQANGQWPLVAWYGFSVVLALIGYIAAKSKS